MKQPTNAVHVEYGPERYYVAEGTGNPTGKLSAQVVVPASGRGRVKEVFVDDTPYAEAMKGSAASVATMNAIRFRASFLLQIPVMVLP
jgi:hypothetical protein